VELIDIKNKIVNELLKQEEEKALFGSSTLIRVFSTGLSRTKELLIIIIEDFDEYKKLLYLGLPKKDKESFSPLSILESLSIEI
jgi:hypothetical protein